MTKKKTEKKNKENNTNTTEKNNKGKFLKRARIALLLLMTTMMMVSVAYNWLSKSGYINTNEKVDYIEFLNQIESGEIEEITVNTKAGVVTYRLADKDDKTLYYTNYPYTEDFIEKMLLSDVDVKILKNIDIDWMGIASVAIMLAMVSVLFNRFKGPKNKNTPSVSEVKFSDIAGMDEIKEDMKYLVEMVKNEEYKKRGAKIPRGILLQGPPGNGKTLLAKAIAGECGMNFIAVGANDFDSPFVGVGSNKVDQVFKEAKEKAPCIIFIDEIDSVGSKRISAQSAASREFNTILMTLLNHMDGFTAADNIIVLAATNRAEELDTALLRPGRFDRKFTVGYPDKSARKELFDLYTKDVTLDPNVNTDDIVRQTYGCSCAEIRNIINEAIINSVNNGRETVNNEDFSAALVRASINGLVRKKARWEGKTKEIVAYHEAGHAVVSHYCAKKKVTCVNIVPTTSSAGGYTMTDNEDDKISELSDIRNRILVLYSGRAAEAILAGDEEKGISTGSSGDIAAATKLVLSYVAILDGVDYSSLGEKGVAVLTERAQDVLREIYQEAKACIKTYWDKVTDVAEKLKEKEMISGDEFAGILESAS